MGNNAESREAEDIVAHRIHGASDFSVRARFGIFRKAAFCLKCRRRHLRHRFATNTLVQWYRSDEDPERRLPVLSAYLGHVHVADTQWYLDSSPELMREAMRRLERRWEVRS